MEPVNFDIPPNFHGRKIMIAETQDEYGTLPAAVTPEGTTMTVWQPSEEEREALSRGEALILFIWNGQREYPPVALRVNNVDYPEDDL